MTSLKGAFISAALGALLLMMPSVLPSPSPFTAKQDRFGLTVVAKNEVSHDH